MEAKLYTQSELDMALRRQAFLIHEREAQGFWGNEITSTDEVIYLLRRFHDPSYFEKWTGEDVTSDRSLTVSFPKADFIAPYNHAAGWLDFFSESWVRETMMITVIETEHTLAFHVEYQFPRKGQRWADVIAITLTEESNDV